MVTSVKDGPITLVFQSQFKQCVIPEKEEYEEYREKIVGKLREVHDWRYKGNIEMDLTVLATD